MAHSDLARLTAWSGLSVRATRQAALVEDIADDLVPRPGFSVARSHLARAQAGRSHINALWNAMRGNQPFSAWVESPEPLVRELWCSFEPDHDLQREADEGMAAFLRDIKAAMDACVLAAANSVPPDRVGRAGGSPDAARRRALGV